MHTAITPDRFPHSSIFQQSLTGVNIVRNGLQVAAKWFAKWAVK